MGLSDSGLALIQSTTLQDYRARYALDKDGKTELLDLGPGIPAINSIYFASRPMNSHGLVAGFVGSLFDGAKAFPYNPHSGKTELFGPFAGDPTENLAWGLGINDSGHVVGHSFT